MIFLGGTSSHPRVSRPLVTSVPLPCTMFVGFFLPQAEGVTELTPKGFIDWCRNGSGYERKHLYDDKKLNEAVQVRASIGVWSRSCMRR